ADRLELAWTPGSSGLAADPARTAHSRGAAGARRSPLSADGRAGGRAAAGRAGGRRELIRPARPPECTVISNRRRVKGGRAVSVITGRCALAKLGVLGVLPGLASGQGEQNGAIAGTVRDTTGAVLPGVNVEVASPALIEKVRTAITDGQGQYRIVD